MSERGQQAHNSVKAKIDLVWMKGGEAREDAVALQRGNTHELVAPFPLAFDALRMPLVEPLPRGGTRTGLTLTTAGSCVGERGRGLRIIR